ncbi:hypothetical protein V8E36_002531 [Tilletia maclaganii]
MDASLAQMAAMQNEALQQAIEQDRQRWDAIATLIANMTDTLSQAVQFARNDSDQRYQSLAAQLKASSLLLLEHSRPVLSQSEGPQLKDIDTNLPSSQKSLSSASQKPPRCDEAECLAKKITELEQERERIQAERDVFKKERDLIHSNFRRERTKFRVFKAWWEANIAVPPTSSSLTAEAGRPNVGTERDLAIENGSPAKRRRIDSGGEAVTTSHASKLSHPTVSSVNGLRNASSPVGEQGQGSSSVRPFLNTPTLKGTPIKERTTVGPGNITAVLPSTGQQSSPGLHGSFANLHLSRSEKKLVRSVGLPLPASPSKRTLLPPEPAAVQMAAEARPVTTEELPQPVGPRKSRTSSLAALQKEREQQMQGVGPSRLRLPAAPVRQHTESSESSSTPSERVETQLNAMDGWVGPSNALALETLAKKAATGPQSPSKASAELTAPLTLQSDGLGRSTNAGATPFYTARDSANTMAEKSHSGAPGGDGTSPSFVIKTEEASEDEGATMNIEPVSNAKSEAGPSTNMIKQELLQVEGPARVRYDLDPALNRGQAYEYTEVVRGRDARRSLIAGECMECKEWYEQVGPSPSPGGPVYEPYGSFAMQMKAAREERKAREQAGSASGTADQSAQPGLQHHFKCRHRAGAAAAEAMEGAGSAGDKTFEAEQRQAHRQAISRHRNTAPVSSTPPGFWDINFPSTQRARELNEETDLQREEHQSRLARDPRYKARVIR